MGSKSRETVNTTDPSTVDNEAERLLVSFRSPETDADDRDDWRFTDTEWLREQMNDDTYRRYLRWAHAGPVAAGDEWTEFVNCGCASPEDVVLRVERVEGGSAVGSGTTLDVVSLASLVEAGVDDP
jgi:hypothetical protein